MTHIELNNNINHNRFEACKDSVLILQSRFIYYILSHPFIPEYMGKKIRIIKLKIYCCSLRVEVVFSARLSNSRALGSGLDISFAGVSVP